MPLPITTYKDYEKGRYKCPFSSITLVDFTDYINSTERQVLDELLGCELATAFVADLTNGQPSEQRFINLFQPICLSFCGTQYRSEGVKEMIQGFVFWGYTRELETCATMQGVQVSNGENQQKADFLTGKAFRVYNTSISAYLVIQEYIKQNIQDYPEFDGQPKEYLKIMY